MPCFEQARLALWLKNASMRVVLCCQQQEKRAELAKFDKEYPPGTKPEGVESLFLTQTTFDIFNLKVGEGGFTREQPVMQVEKKVSQM